MNRILKFLFSLAVVLFLGACSNASSSADDDAPFMSYFSPTMNSISEPVISVNMRGTIDVHECESSFHGSTMGISSEEHRLSSMMGNMDKPAI